MSAPASPPRWRSGTRSGGAPGRHRLAGAARTQRDGPRLANEPDTDPTDPVARRWLTGALGVEPDQSVPGELDEAGIDRVVRTAAAGAARWAALPPAERAAILERCAEELAARRPALVALMAREAGKTVAEADTEVSEAVDFARYYAAGRASWTGSTARWRARLAPSP